MIKYKNTLIKRALSLVLCICCIGTSFLFSSCSLAEKKAAIKINSVDISDDVVSYFLDKASNEIDFEKGKKPIQEKTVALCSTYVKTNTLADEHKVKLTIDERVAISEKVNAYWSVYGSYYEKIGVRKDTLTKIFTADTYRDKLILTYYGKGGPEEISENRLYASFQSNYVVFQAITGYLTTSDLAGNTVQISKEEIETLVLQFQNTKTMVNAGEYDMNGAADYLNENGVSCSVQTVVLHKDDSTFPEGFFEKVQASETRASTVIASNDYIFLVLRGEAGINSDYYVSKKVDIIKSIVGNDIDSIIEDAYSFTGTVSSPEFNSYYTLIKKEKES